MGVVGVRSSMGAIGQVLLLLGGVLAVAAAALPFVTRRPGRRATTAAGALAASAACLVGATVALMVALVQNDFSLVYVADTSRRAMSAPYRAAAVWGGMEGSLLFWTALLAT